MSMDSNGLIVFEQRSKTNTITIEGGCLYDYQRHKIIHDDGPMSNYGCVHKKGQNDRELADRVREQYAAEIEMAKSGEREQQARTFVSEEKVLARFKELILDGIDAKIPFDIRKFEWPFSQTSSPFVGLLCFESYDKKYNCCASRRRCELSEDFLARIPRDSDAFDSIMIPCVDPEVDIEWVTLLAGKDLPKDKRDSLGGEYIFHESSCRNVLVPIKTMTDVKSNVISFASHPIPTHPRVDFWVQIKYKSDLHRRFVRGAFAVVVEQLCMGRGANERDRFNNNAWKSYYAEPAHGTTVFLE